MRRGIPPLPQYDFMTWCLVTKSTRTALLYFALLLDIGDNIRMFLKRNRIVSCGLDSFDSE